jgi:Fe-Mn family superoxide dismutase
MSNYSRREIMRGLGGVAAASIGGLSGRIVLAADEKKPRAGGPFKLPDLPYEYGALEPSIDEKTMRIHHDKHHKAYVDNLNKALDGHPDLMKMTIIELMSHTDKAPESIRQAVINNGGGHSNHSIFWKIMAPPSHGGGGEPSGELAGAIKSTFGDVKTFKEKLTDAGMKRFGSGWAWLVTDKSDKLSIESFPNQDSPYMKGLIPLVGVDVWEHAYYLKYQNMRADYIKAWWNVVNWKEVENHFGKTRKRA